MALGHATKQLLWIRNLLCDLTGTNVCAKLFCNNQAAVRICSDNVSNKRTRHTDREFYITNQAFFRRQIDISWVSTKLQFADVLTKNLSPVIHEFQRSVVQGEISASGGVLKQGVTYPITPTTSDVKK